MVLYCKNCGEKEEFYRMRYGHTYFSEQELIDKDGEPIDYQNYEEDETEIDDEGEIKCMMCDEEVEDLSIDEIRDFDPEYARELEREEKGIETTESKTLKTLLGD